MTVNHTSQVPKAGSPAAGGETWWHCVHLPDTESGWLTGPQGPLAGDGGPGRIERLPGGGVRLDRLAVHALSALAVKNDDGRIEWDDLVPILRISDGSWPLVAGPGT
jgi:hypothetical protein